MNMLAVTPEERRGEGKEADQRGCFEFYVASSSQLMTALAAPVHRERKFKGQRRTCGDESIQELWKSHGVLGG